MLTVYRPVVVVLLVVVVVVVLLLVVVVVVIAVVVVVVVMAVVMLVVVVVAVFVVTAIICVPSDLRELTGSVLVCFRFSATTGSRRRPCLPSQFIHMFRALILQNPVSQLTCQILPI